MIVGAAGAVSVAATAAAVSVNAKRRKRMRKAGMLDSPRPVPETENPIRWWHIAVWAIALASMAYATDVAVRLYFPR